MATLNLTSVDASLNLGMKGFELIQLLDRKSEPESHWADPMVESLVHTQYAYKEEPFQGEEMGRSLMELPLTDTTKVRLFRRLNAWQVMALQRSSPTLFQSFCKKVLDSNQMLYLRFFEQAKSMNLVTLKNSFRILEHTIKQDPTLFGEMVRFLDTTHPVSPEVDALVVEAAKRIDPTFDEEQLEKMKKRRFRVQRHVVSLQVTAGVPAQEICSIDNISLSRLREYNYFKTHLDRWDKSQSQIKPCPPLHLEVDEGLTKNDFEWLFYFIQTKTPLPVEKTPSVLTLADYLGIVDCVEDCYETMMQNQDHFRAKLGRVGFLRFLFDYAHFDGAHALHKEALAKECHASLQTKEVAIFNELVEIAIEENCMDTILIIANSLDIPDCVHSCYTQIIKKKNVYVNQLGITRFLQFLFDHAHFEGSEALHKKEFKQEFRNRFLNGEVEIVSELVELAEQLNYVDDIKGILQEVQSAS